MSGTLSRQNRCGADSTPRRALKQLLHPFMAPWLYRGLHAIAKAWDIRTGAWYEPEIELLSFAVARGETALDVGANFGLYAYHLARAVGPAGHVYAFEPVPSTVQGFRLVARLLQFRNVELIPKGCGERTESARFRIPVQVSGALSAGLTHLATRNDDRPGRDRQVRWSRTEEIACDVVALDDFLPATVAPSFIKCDIEGGELFALRGARRLIERSHPTVLLEVNPWYLDGLGVPLRELVGFLVDRGYELYRYDPAPGRRLRSCDLEDIVEANYLFVHSSRRSRFARLFSQT